MDCKNLLQNLYEKLGASAVTSRKGYWRTIEGVVLKIVDMDDNHLRNSERFLRRKIDKAHNEFECAAMHVGGGEAASYYAAQTMDDMFGISSRLSKKRRELLEEMKRRKLDPKTEGEP